MKRGDEAEVANEVKETLRLPRTAEPELAMIKGEVPRFHRGNYNSLEVKDEDNV